MSTLLAGRNLYEQHSAAQQSKELLQQAQQQMGHPQPPFLHTQGTEGEEPEPNSDVQDVWNIFNIAGVLSLPDLGLELPVLADYSEDLLKVSVCIFDFGDVQEPARMVIAGHNYKAHLGSLSKIPIGAAITYQAIDGEKSRFQETEIVEIGADDGAALKEGTWDLTLLTCNLDMSKRILVRCLEKQ